jgi:hypothetical protein
MISKQSVWILRQARRAIHDLARGRGLHGISYNPYDKGMLAKLADDPAQTLDVDSLGSVERARHILRHMEHSFPTTRLRSAYMRNLDALLGSQPKRKSPGQLVLGLGTGRCGSTMLAHLFASAEGSLVTHENPPLIFWKPEEDQIQFHLERFARLLQYHALVGDVAHWWINVIDRILLKFPDIKLIGAIRDVEECAMSFMRIKGYGSRSLNHWVPYGTGKWLTHHWDPTYPSYKVPSNIGLSLDYFKYNLVRQYISNYNNHLRTLAERLPGQILLVRTEHLSDPTVQLSIFEFLGTAGRLSRARLNVRGISDGMSDVFRF